MNDTPRRMSAREQADLLRTALADGLRETVGFKEPFAGFIATHLVEYLRERFVGAGREIYLPAPDKLERDEEIRRAYDGTNLKDVCARYQVSPATVYRAAARRAR